MSISHERHSRIFFTQFFHLEIHLCLGSCLQLLLLGPPPLYSVVHYMLILRTNSLVAAPLSFPVPSESGLCPNCPARPRYGRPSPRPPPQCPSTCGPTSPHKSIQLGAMFCCWPRTLDKQPELHRCMRQFLQIWHNFS